MFCSLAYADSPDNWNLASPSKDPNKTSQYNFDNAMYTHFNQLQVVTTDPNGNRLGNIGDMVMYKNGSTYTPKIEITSPSGTVWQSMGGSSGTGIPGGSVPNIQYNLDGTNFGGVLGSGADLNGNIGLGTTAPSAKLDVLGTNKMTGFQLTTNPSSGFIVVGNSVGVGTWMNATTLPGQFWSQTGNNLYPTTIANNVGVGTNVPTNKFFIQGNLGIGSTDRTNAIQVTGGGALAYGISVFSGGAGSNTDGRILASGNGALAGGEAGDSACGPSLDKILASGRGSAVLGFSSTNCDGSGSGDSTLTATGLGSIAVGAARGGLGNASSITASGTGAFAAGHADSGGAIVSSGNGSWAGGKAFSGSSNNITSSGSGAFAFGATSGASANITASNSGAIAMGYSDGTLQATGQGSVAIGYNVQSKTGNAITLGKSLINNDANTFQVGFTAGQPTFFADSANVGIGTRQVNSKLVVWNGNVGIGTSTAKGPLDLGTATQPIYMFGIKANSGTRYICIDTNGLISSSASACSGT